MEIIKGIPLHNSEEELYYGDAKTSVGHTYKFFDGNSIHYYLQRKNDVLHVNPTGKIINSLHRGYLNKKSVLELITYDEFKNIIIEFINSIEINKFLT